MLDSCFKVQSASAVGQEPTSAVWDRQESAYTHGVRTADDPTTLPARALQKLREGNERFVNGTSTATTTFNAAHRQALAVHGQNPMAAIIGCADSRVPLEILFDVQPGDVFVLRNAGNTLTHAEGSMVGSVEYCIGPLGAKLVLVIGHTKCGAIGGATQTMLSRKKEAGSGGQPPASKTSLDKVLASLGPVAEQAQLELPPGASAEEIAAHAVTVNVFAGMEKLLIYSEPIRKKVEAGEVEVHGAVYDIVSGEVKFLGQHPRLPLLLGTRAGFVQDDKVDEEVVGS